MEQKVSYKKQEARLLLRDRERIRGTSHWINESSADLQSTVSLKVESLIGVVQGYLKLHLIGHI